MSIKASYKQAGGRPSYEPTTIGPIRRAYDHRPNTASLRPPPPPPPRRDHRRNSLRRRRLPPSSPQILYELVEFAGTVASSVLLSLRFPARWISISLWTTLLAAATSLHQLHCISKEPAAAARKGPLRLDFALRKAAAGETSKHPAFPPMPINGRPHHSTCWIFNWKSPSGAMFVGIFFSWCSPISISLHGWNFYWQRNITLFVFMYILGKPSHWSVLNMVEISWLYLYYDSIF
jgi:hypothetical protein